jgi:hypothetical protein
MAASRISWIVWSDMVSDVYFRMLLLENNAFIASMIISFGNGKLLDRTYLKISSLYLRLSFRHSRGNGNPVFSRLLDTRLRGYDSLLTKIQF